jgi:hypothetical protein
VGKLERLQRPKDRYDFCADLAADRSVACLRRRAFTFRWRSFRQRFHAREPLPMDESMLEPATDGQSRGFSV